MKQRAAGVADFDVQEIIRRRRTLLRTAVEPEGQICSGRRGNRDRLVSLSRHVVINAEIHVARPAVGIVSVVGVKGAGARQDPGRYAAFQRSIHDQLSRSWRWGRCGGRGRC